MQETRDKYEKILEANKKRLLNKIENTDERIKKQIQEEEEESDDDEDEEDEQQAPDDYEETDAMKEKKI